MSTFKQKNVINCYKLRLKEKLKTVTEETENAASFLNNCVEQFRERVQHILEIKDEKCLSLYRQLNRDLESYSEKLFILQASFGEVLEEESDSSEDEGVRDKVQNTQPKTLSPVPSQNERLSQAFSGSENHVNVQKQESVDVQKFAENVDLQNYAEKSVPAQQYTKENTNDQRSLEENTKYNNHDEDGGSVTEDDYCSLHSVDNVQNINSCTFFSSQSHGYENELISENDCASSLVSQSSYRSICSSISEPFANHRGSKSSHFAETCFVETNKGCSLETSDPSLVIQSPNLDVCSHFSGTLSYIIDPSNFWIQIENSHGYKFSFSKSENSHLKGLSSIKKGSYCLAPFKSAPFYYRAQSLSEGKSEKEIVQILFIDHGSTQEISVCDLRPLPKSAYEVSAQAIHCYLHGIVPSEDLWSLKCIERFKDFQKFCIDAVVKSKESLYGVQLVATPSADFDEDFSVDIAQTLCLDGFAVSLNEKNHVKSTFSSASFPLKEKESQLPDDNHYLKSEFSKTFFNKIDSSLDMSGSYDINAISNDSGVSVTSTYKSSQTSDKRNEIFHKVSKDCISSVTMKHDKEMLDIQDLILFDSSDNLNKNLIQNSSRALNLASNSLSSCCPICWDQNFCLHLSVPSPSLLFVEKDMVIVMLSHVVNPHEFYVNMAMENIDSLDDLREQMTSTYESEKDLHKLKASDLTENMFCAGRFNADGYWYRVKVIRISPEDKEKDQVLVHYIDYGNSSVIQCCDLRPLTTEYSKYPSFAIKCTLAGVTPVKNTRSGTDSSCWEEDAINCFKKLTSFDRCLTAQICSELFNDQIDAYPVLLWDTKDSNDLLINAQLAEYKIAVFDYSPLSKVLTNQKEDEKSQIDSWDPMVEDYYDSDNNYTLDDENIEVMTTGYKAKDEDYTCKYFALHGYCPRGKNCNYKHLPLLESGLTHDQEEVYCLDTVPIISESVNNILVQVSAITTPTHFYVVLPFGCKTVDDIDNLVYKGSSYDEIINSEVKALFYGINNHYSNAPFNENTTIALSCGTIVVAKRKWDEKWHRGRIVDVVGINKPSKVFFVDSGDNEWVPRKFIRTILPQFLHTPFQAVQVSLHGIEPIGSEKGLSWSLEALKYFKDIVAGEILLAKIVHRFGQAFHVHLRKTSQNDHSDVAELLVSAGFAQYHRPVHSNKKQTVYVPG